MHPSRRFLLTVKISDEIAGSRLTRVSDYLTMRTPSRTDRIYPAQPSNRNHRQMSEAIRTAFGALIKQVSAAALAAEESGDEAEFGRIMEFRTNLAKLRDNFLAGAAAKAPRKPRGPRKSSGDVTADPAAAAEAAAADPASAEAAAEPAAPAADPPPPVAAQSATGVSVRRRAA